MLPIQLVETDRDDFEGPVVEFWRADDFIGMAFFDGESPIVQIYPDADGGAQDLDIHEIQGLLDMAVRMVDPLAFDEGMEALRQEVVGEPASGDHPATTLLLEEFDAQARHRTEDGEGFFSKEVAGQFIAKCEELDLAVVEMEGMDFEAGKLIPRPGLDLIITPQSMMSWPEFRTYANATAQDSLRSWSTRASVLFAFVIQQPDAETIVA
jgi:hypothetical protein